MKKRMRIKTEHAGAKNGGGYYGPRAVAKHISSRIRRAVDKLIIRDERRDSSS